jgi:hypothetical protein
MRDSVIGDGRPALSRESDPDLCLVGSARVVDLQPASEGGSRGRTNDVPAPLGEPDPHGRDLTGLDTGDAGTVEPRGMGAHEDVDHAIARRPRALRQIAPEGDPAHGPGAAQPRLWIDGRGPGRRRRRDPGLEGADVAVGDRVQVAVLGSRDAALIPVVTQEAAGTASMAGLPVTRVWVLVGPPLSASAASRTPARGTAGTMSVTPGSKPPMPASPSWPKRLEPLAMIAAEASLE